MSVRYLNQRIPRAAFLQALMLCAGPAGVCHAADMRPASTPSSFSGIQSAKPVAPIGSIIHRIEFRGLRRIPAATLRARITSREGEPIDAKRIEEDVRALDRLGWFDSVSVEVEEIPVLIASREPSDVPVDPLLRLVFVVEERPFLAGIEYKGSHVLKPDRVAALLAEKGITLRLAAPVNRNELWRAGRAIETALADERHPLGRVHIRLDELPSAAVQATLEIYDGPEVTVARVEFRGNLAFSQTKLRKQMKQVVPEAHFAGLRGKDVYTPQRLQADLGRLAEFYRDHGYPEARVGQPAAEMQPARVWRWRPWPKRQTAPRYQITIPVEEGRFYRLTAVEVHRSESSRSVPAADGEAAAGAQRLVARLGLRSGEAYSQAKLERARDVLAHLRDLRPANAPSLAPEVGVTPQWDRESGAVRVAFDVRQAKPYTIHHIEFRGQQRFSDRYYRKRVLVSEGGVFEPEKLERGLAQLARAGFIRPVKPEDVRTQFDDTRHTVNLAIRVQEIGRQRISLTGGHTNLGSTLGLVYNVFDLLGGEELITAHLEGGPESAQILLGLAKESLFGTRVSLGLSIYQNVVKPALAGHQRLFTASSSGFGTNWSYPLTPEDTLGASYQISRTRTRYGALVPSQLAGLPGAALRADTASRTVGLSETHETPQERFLSSVAASGGWLGGDENLVRSTMDFSRVFGANSAQRSSNHNTWAFRGYLSGVSAFRGDLPVTARIFAGDELVRGASFGELGPYALNRTRNSDGTTSFRADPAGASLVAAVNTEYRVPVAPRTQAAAFFDAGSGWLLPNWLGPDRPALAGGVSNLRVAAGLEVKWLIPGIDQTLRIHYDINPFHIRRVVVVDDGPGLITVSLPHRRRGALGWALGSLF